MIVHAEYTGEIPFTPSKKAVETPLFTVSVKVSVVQHGVRRVINVRNESTIPIKFLISKVPDQVQKFTLGVGEHFLVQHPDEWIGLEQD